MDRMDRHVCIDFTNWRGDRSSRLVVPRTISFASTRLYPAEQWLLYASEGSSGVREFALAGIHSWEMAQNVPFTDRALAPPPLPPTSH